MKNFFFPRFTKAFRIRVLLVALLSVIIFRYILVPINVQGLSMEPTITDGSLHFYFRLSYLFSTPERFDIVTVRLAGSKVLLLKRIIAFPGESVAFRQGNLYINGKLVQEPQHMYPSDWELGPRTVKAGTFYIVGDNRSVPIQQHRFGQIDADRILGKVVW